MASSVRDESTLKLHLCVVAHNAFAAVFPQEGQAVGGAETGAWTIARGLARTAGCRVTFYLRSSQTLPSNSVDGVSIVRRRMWFPEKRRRVSESVERRAGFPWIRVLKFRFALLWEIPFLLLTRPFRRADLQPLEADADLLQLAPDGFVIFGASADTSTVVATAERLNVPVILMIQSNANLPSADRETDAYGEKREIVRQTLQRASAIVCQSGYQQERLQEVSGRDATVVPPPIDLNEWPAAARDGEYVLWVGRSDRFHKRPHLLVELARRCPEIPFLMVMNRQDPDVYDSILKDLPANVTHRAYVPFDQMPDVFAAARLFVSTGNPEYEGFPNVLLQAAAVGVPIVSMHDFDDFLTSSRAGVACGDNLHSMMELLREIWNARPSFLASPAEVRDWLQQHHSLENVCERITDLVSAHGHPEPG